ncbi:MAG: methyltransferase domain-containing protein [Sandaracinaceae bacterium]|nr:methyltransferase domain-containing protein [Sandaracinaceae bacterium]
MTEPPFDRSSRSRLTRRDLHRFTGSSLFDRVARVVCDVGHLPRKELFESWEVARRVRRRMRGGRIVDLACGHGLVAHLMVLLDDTSPDARGVDIAVPPTATMLADAFTAEWPRLAGRVTVAAGSIEDTALEPSDLAVAVHACGGLTDVVLDHAIAARARVAVMACCHDAAENDQGSVGAWLPPGLAIDVTRVARLRHSGYDVRTQLIPADITPENRLVLATPISAG